jgi:hypothetical protein
MKRESLYSSSQWIRIGHDVPSALWIGKRGREIGRQVCIPYGKYMKVALLQSAQNFDLPHEPAVSGLASFFQR